MNMGEYINNIKMVTIKTGWIKKIITGKKIMIAGEIITITS